MKTALLSLVIFTGIAACRQEFHSLPKPDTKTTTPVSGTIAQPTSPISGCSNKTFAQNLLGWWAYTSNHLVNPSGGSTKYLGQIMFKANMSFEDPDSLFGYQLQNENIIARLYELRGDTLRMYVTDKLERQQGVILILQTADCENLKFIGIGKGGNVNTELTR